MVSRESWNSLIQDANPFLLYDWLLALERSGCASAETGWQPVHIIAERMIQEGADGGEGSNKKTEVVAAIPLYAKSHSYGEFIFDQSWADYAQRVLGIKYYPKLLAAVPFTPATGSRVLLSQTLTAAEATGVASMMTNAMKTLIQQNKISGAHVNFLKQEDVPIFLDQGYVLRQTVQYCWKNRRLPVDGNEQKFRDMKSVQVAGDDRDVKDRIKINDIHSNKFADFEDYLTSFKSKRRTQIKRERKSVTEEQGIVMKVIRGDDELHATPELYQKMFEIYTKTIDKMWGQRYLSSEFFAQLHAAPAEFKHRLVFIVAYEPGLAVTGGGDTEGGKERALYNVKSIVAGTINLVSDTHFYGRYWGALEYRKHLHFETCYYKSIEFCIDNKLEVLEPGAGGGEFKFLRGFNPYLVNSVHTFTSPVLQQAVNDFVVQERDYNNELKDFLLENSAVGGVEK
jgi:uncharacterized protein